MIASLAASSRRLALRLQKEGAGRCIGTPNHQSRGHAFRRHGAQSLPWVLGCVCFAYVWAGLGHSRSRAESKSEQFRKRARQKASTSQSEQFSKRALQKASTSDSKHFTKQALHKANTSESKHFRKQALKKASTSESKHFGSKHLCNQHFTVQSKQRACQQAGHRASKLKARIQQCTGVSRTAY